MNLDQAVLDDPAVEDIDAQIETVLAMMSNQELQRLQAKLRQLYRLEYSETDAHPFNIKTIIKGRDIRFARGVSPASRAFMILHSLGHYFFICAAKRKNIERYDYIYDLRGVQTALHYYETAGQGSGLDQPPPMTEQKRKDRVSFEVGANRFAADLLADIGFGQAAALIQRYQVGDINYILDVSRGGKAAIVPSDHDYLRRYICAGLSIDPDDAYDDGVYDPDAYRRDGIDWQHIEDIRLEIHFF
ncbi:hypothetical protein VK98_20535 [Chromobacterium sp. LK11]|uniref:hypothetical protein n=1 Tax=Chromobacterium sp. LK11 TaxID=1628212 RepID=UPI00065342E4|nr:hypothetical protein [Chromobacterium sp. LK11]KMN76596.1 hypothetical protein VK98_20535 [Chromobacterium sp. LK11]